MLNGDYLPAHNLCILLPLNGLATADDVQLFWLRIVAVVVGADYGMRLRIPFRDP